MASTASIPAYLSSGIPVVQPTHLEGDANFATEILPGPPCIASIQQSVLKRDPKKPSTAFSYLPTSDPGSTYSGIVHGTLIGHETDISRFETSRPITGRAQRASARQQNGAVVAIGVPAEACVSAGRHFQVDLESHAGTVDDESSISRSNSIQNLQDCQLPNSTGRPRRKEKGKGKEIDRGYIRVKEEPKTVSLLPYIQSFNLGNNDDHCSSCRSFGALVYCDGCPRAFHLWCLDPPMESVDEGDSRWFCPTCVIRKHPPRKPPSSLLSCLIQQVDNSIPTEFQLPDDIKSFFKDVTTGPKGTYIDSSETKQPRFNRHGEQDCRDPYRLRDRNGAPILCFRCGTSALPGNLAAAIPSAKRPRRLSTVKDAMSEAWRPIISCDYCNLHWHLDCLDPPLPNLPTFLKKWMCPNHADKSFPPKRRVLKGAPPIEVTIPGQINNGHIEIINMEPNQTGDSPQVVVDEVLINGRRYRIPERVIVLDFWNKLRRPEHRLESLHSAMSSPLTSLSSLDDIDVRRLPDQMDSARENDEKFKAAQLLCSLRSKNVDPMFSAPLSSRKDWKLYADNGVQTEPDFIFPSEPAVGRRIMRLPKAAAGPKLKKSSSKSLVTGTSNVCLDDGVMQTSESLAIKRKRPSGMPVQTGKSARELRSRSKIDSSLTSISSRSSMKKVDDSPEGDVPALVPPHPPSAPCVRSVHIKTEEMESNLFFDPTSIPEVGLLSQTPIKFGTKLNRENKERRGRKRKQLEVELPQLDRCEHLDQASKPGSEKKARKPRGGRKQVRTPLRTGTICQSTPTIPPALAPKPVPTTPSLKIRLPRIGNSKITSNDVTSSTL